MEDSCRNERKKRVRKISNRVKINLKSHLQQSLICLARETDTKTSNFSQTLSPVKYTEIVINSCAKHIS